jgi:beta-xylosidase
MKRFAGVIVFAMQVLLFNNAALNAQTPFWGDMGDGTFKNPVLWADYNNLDVIRVGTDFYMIAASHHFMGMPVLHSKDMVNWTIISRIYNRLDLDVRYNTPGLAYQHGTWAPAIRYHDNKFWVYVCTPLEGLIMTTAVNPAGPWAPWYVVKDTVNLEDPCPYWDDIPNAGGDGPNGERAYLVRSKLGANLIQLHRMSWDGKTLLDTGLTITRTPSTIEGPKLHKRNGYYYIFAPAGGIDSGNQYVLRSQNILGPYTSKNILEKGTTPTNGPHQGSWIDLDNGQSWFYHFQQKLGWGRVAHLEPAAWGTDNWPTIGIDNNGNGVGEPVARPTKPNVGATYPVQVPQSSDEFTAGTLGLQWLWNHNPDTTKWSLTARPGWLRLTARPLANKSGVNGTGGAVTFSEDNIIFAYNTLVQEAMGRKCSAIAKVDMSGMINGQRAGITLFGQVYGWIGIDKESSGATIRTKINGTYTNGPVFTGTDLYLKAALDTLSRISFAYSLDGSTFTTLGSTTQAVDRTWYEGIKFGLFTYNLSTGTVGGWMDVDYFRYTQDGPQPTVAIGQTAKQTTKLASAKNTTRMYWAQRGSVLIAKTGAVGNASVVKKQVFNVKGESKQR